MRKLTIAQIKDLEDGEIIPAFEAELKQLFAMKSRPSSYGDGNWNTQDMRLVDPDGDEIMATWTGDDKFAGEPGDVFHFESTQTKHGLRGISRKGAGTRYDGIKITNVAKITKKKDDFDEEEPPEAVAPKVVKPLPKKSVIKQLREQMVAESDPIVQVRQRLTQVSAVYRQCLDFAAKDRNWFEENYGVTMADAHFQAMTSTYFINVDKEGLVSEVSPIEPSVPQEPTEATSARSGVGARAPYDDEVPF